MTAAEPELNNPKKKKKRVMGLTDSGMYDVSM